MRTNLRIRLTLIPVRRIIIQRIKSDRISVSSGSVFRKEMCLINSTFFWLQGCRELLYRTASRILPGLCKDLADWQDETRKKASGLLPVILLHLEASVTQHTQLLISGLSAGIADSLLRVTSSQSGAGSLYLVLMRPDRGLPSLASIAAVAAEKSRQAAAPSSDVAEALGVIQQLFSAARYTGCFVASKVSSHCILQCCSHDLNHIQPCLVTFNF